MGHRNDYINFVKHYDLIREILRQYYIAGMSSNNAKRSQRDYNNQIRRVRNFIDEEFLKHDNINKIKYNRFYVENYTKIHNFLYDSYLIKNVDVDKIKAYFVILQTLNKYEEIKNSELMEDVNSLVWKSDIITNKNDKDQFVERVKDKMVSLGVIDKRKEGRDTILSIKKDIFEDFSEYEIIQIINAISFYSNVSIISAPGYSILDVIIDYLLGERKCEYNFESTFSFKNNFLSRILDDEIISMICDSIKNKRLLEFKYNKRNIKVIPQKIVTEYRYGRQYLIAEDLIYNSSTKYRIDKMSSCKIGKKFSYNNESLSKEIAKIKVEIDFYIDEENEDYIIRRVQKESSGDFFKIEKNHFLYVEYVEDTVSIIPWIRSFGTIAKVRASDEYSLKEKIQKEYEELLQKYNIEV